VRRGGERDGLLLVDKTAGITSFDVVAEVRRRLGVRRVGHAGTLDPLATGLLPVLVGEATKLTPWLMGLDKVYRATVRLGEATDTYDREGRVTARADAAQVAAIARGAVEEALAGFVGRIRQRPPAFSAIKRNGKRLYQLARAAAPDAPIEVEERDVVVHAIALLAWEPPEVRCEVRCGKGTYVRSIAHDLGARLGVHGHLAALRRTRVGGFSVEEAVDLGALPAGAPLPLLPLEHAVDHLPAVAVDAEAERRLRMGQQAALAGLPVPAALAGPVRLVDDEGHLVAIAVADAPGRLTLARVLHGGEMAPRRETEKID
jgi:tRNA pseudouridine55 synthase